MAKKRKKAAKKKTKKKAKKAKKAKKRRRQSTQYSLKNASHYNLCERRFFLLKIYSSVSDSGIGSASVISGATTFEGVVSSFV